MKLSVQVKSLFWKEGTTMGKRFRRNLAVVISAAMAVTAVPSIGTTADAMGNALQSKAASTKETLPCGYEIDMGNLPKVYFSEHPEWEEIYDATWEIHKNNISKIPAATNPEEPYYVDEAFSGNIFVWDTMLMMMFDKYGINEFPTLPSIDNFYYNQVDSDDERDGYICREIVESTGKDYWDYATKKNTGTNPPLFAMAEWEQYQIHGDVSRFSKVINGKTIYERLIAQYNYIERNKKMENGLYGKTNGFGNGLDNTPNQDGYRLSTDDADGRQTYNDLSIQQAQAAWYISLIAEAMGKEEDARYFLSEHDRIAALINEKLWSEEAQMYSNIAEDGVTKTNVSTPTNLWALAGRVATDERAKAIIENHGLNSQKLYRPQGLATTAYDWENEVSRFHAEGAYWLGSVWAPTSYQYVYGLREYGYDQLAFEEAVRHVNMAADVYQAGKEGNGVSQATVWENYSSEYTKNGSQSRANFAGWTGSFGVGMVLEDLIGIDINAPENIVTWNVQLTEEFGVDNLYMKHEGVENRVSLHANKRISDLSDLHFTATVTQPVTLVVKAGGSEKTFQLEAGTHSYTVEGTADESELPGYIGSIGYPLSDASEKAQKAYYDDNALDYVFFGNEENEAIDDGIVYQTGKNNGLLYNINTVGIPASQGSVQLDGSASMEALGFADAQSVSKGMSSYGDEGFMFMAPASNRLQTMRLVVGVQNGTATLKAGLNDASDARVEASYRGGSAESEYVIDVPFCAASNDTRMMVQWVLDSNNSGANARVSVKSAALLDGGIYVPSVPEQVKLTAAGDKLTVAGELPQGESFDCWHVELYDALSGELVKEILTKTMPYEIGSVPTYSRYYAVVSGERGGIRGGNAVTETVLAEPEGITDDDRAIKDLELTLQTIYNGNTDQNVRNRFEIGTSGVLYGSKFTLVSSTDGAGYGVMNDGSVVRPSQETGDVLSDITITAACGGGNAVYKAAVLVRAVTEDSGYVLCGGAVGYSGQILNLTEEGTSDWYQFRENVSQFETGAQSHKKGGSGISGILRNVAAVPGGEQGLCKDAPITYTYDAADLTGEKPIDHYGTQMRGVGNYLKFNLGYSEKNQRVNLYVGSWNGVGTVQFLVNGNVVTSQTYGNSGMGVYQIGFDYLLDNPTDVAEVRLRLDSMTAYGNTNGSVFLHAVTLAEKERASGEASSSIVKLETKSASGVTVNLTEEGTTDWFQLPQDSETDYARKAGGFGFSEFKRNHTAVPNGEKGCVKDGPIYYTATDADENYPAPKNRYGMQVRGVGNGMEIRVGYADVARMVKFYTGVWNGQAEISFIINGEKVCGEIVGNPSGGMQVFCTTVQYQLENPDDVAVLRLTLTSSGSGNGSTFIFGGTMADMDEYCYPIQTTNGKVCDESGAAVAEAAAGSVLTAAAKSYDGARFIGWKAEGLSLTEEQQKAETFTFTMPSGMIALNAQYELLPVSVTGVTLNYKKIKLTCGEEYTLSARVLPLNAAETGLVWSSDNEAVVTVDADGKIAAVKAGEANVTVATLDGDFRDTCEVIVRNPVSAFVRQSLQTLYDTWAAADTSVYAKEGVEALTEALAAAEAVLADPDAAQEELTSATSALVKAVGSLEYGVQKLHLETAIEFAENILVLENNYDETDDLKAAVAEGRKVLDDENAVQEEADEAAYAILDELAKLAKKADIKSLESLIEAAEGLNNEKYTSESADVLKEAIEHAKEVVGDQNRSEDAVSEAYKGIIDAVIGLKMRGSKAALAAMIAKAEIILAEQDMYAAATLEGIEEELAAAKAVYDDEDAVQDEIDKAVKALTLETADARLLGDVDGDGRITTSDTAAVLSASAELTNLLAAEEASADVNGDGAADTTDAALILQYAAEKITAF